MVCNLTTLNLDNKNFLKILIHKNLFFQADLDNLINYYLFFFATHPQIETSGLFVFVLPPCGWSTGFLATPRTLDFLPKVTSVPALPKTKYLYKTWEFLPKITKQKPETHTVRFDGNKSFTILKSVKVSSSWQYVPFAVAYLFLFLIKTLDIKLYLFKNFSKTKLPGSSFIQYFCGKLEKKVRCPTSTPCI